MHFKRKQVCVLEYCVADLEDGSKVVHPLTPSQYSCANRNILFNFNKPS